MLDRDTYPKNHTLFSGTYSDRPNKVLPLGLKAIVTGANWSYTVKAITKTVQCETVSTNLREQSVP